MDYLQVDGYVGYEQTEATLVGCFAHARIKFIEVQRAQVKGKTGKADWAIKPFVIGRNNWRFSNTANGAQASAMLYSLIETAKANGLTPFDYLHHLLEEMPRDPVDIERLLPWNVDLPKNIKR